MGYEGEGLMQIRTGWWVAGVGLCLLVGCGRGPEVAGTAPGGAPAKLRIAVIPKGTTHVFWRSVERGAKQAGTELGVEIVWKGPLKEDDRGQQIGLVEQFTAEKVARKKGVAKKGS
jgi:ribose transport system substrate-binding protein